MCVCGCISEFFTHSFTESINDCHHCGYIKNKGKCAAIKSNSSRSYGLVADSIK